MYAKVFVSLRGDDLTTNVTNSSLARRALELVTKVFVLEELGLAVWTGPNFGQGHSLFHLVNSLLAVFRVRVHRGAFAVGILLQF